MISREDVAKELYVQRWVRTGDTRESAEAAWRAGWANQDVRECRADADAILALIQPEVAEVEGVLEVETSARKCWEERVRKAEEERDTWKDCIAEEMAENIKLFNLLGVTPEIEVGRAGTDAIVDAVQKLKADLAAALDALSACHRSGRKAEAAEDREASLADLLNSWARESGVAPCDRPEDSKGVADRLWAKLSLDLAAAREKARNAEALAANLKRLENERAIELMHIKRDLATVGDAVGRLVQAAEDAHRQGRITAALCAAIADPALAAWRGK